MNCTDCIYRDMKASEFPCSECRRIDCYAEKDMFVPTGSIKDSGNRTEFSTGAVRDIQEGKGRCDLMPLDVVAMILDDDEEEPYNVMKCIHDFIATNDIQNLRDAIYIFRIMEWPDTETMLLDVAKHFEDGAVKYGENNWQKGIPVKRYIDSAARHYLKVLRGDNDEPHERAFVWNIMCAIWTCIHKPELNDYAPKGGEPND